MCTWLNVSRSGFYEWRRKEQSATARRREEIKGYIQYFFDASDGTYGYRRIHADLRDHGIACGAELVRALMRELGLQPCQPRPWRHSLTDAGDTPHRIPDLVHRDFTADKPGQKLVGDITYIPTWQGWLFLATVIDCHTREVIGWAMDDNYRGPPGGDPSRDIQARLSTWAILGKSWPTRRTGEFAQVGASLSQITQIYEGTNQVQRIVMSRQLLKG
ncbi:hypothetical protein JCM9533A_42360 [Catenuloplanes niger JCM 9533]|uniref:Transposase n=1 Tax=Catenuloplanes niger TaxID=587534 RepID=A0AAE4CR94_9ACTN|nr:hypothetical protein [Catenuloplanes niger]